MSSDLTYALWKAEHQSIIESFCDKNIILLFSGGKDSSAAMDLMARAKDEFGFEFTAHTGTFPVHRYPDPEKERLESYWMRRGVKIIWHDVGEKDDYLIDSENPCLPCQELRKNLLNRILKRSIEDWSSLLLVVCYTLWDIVSYSLEHLLTHTFSHPDKRISIEKNSRFKETTQRFYPLLTMKEGYQIFRPLIKYNADDILEVILRKNVPILSTPCKFKNFRPKRILENYYEKMGLRFDYNRLMHFADKSLDLPEISSVTSTVKEDYLVNTF